MNRLPPLLEVRDLSTHFFTRKGIVRAVDGVSFSIDRGETLALVGESGCGKSMTALSLQRLVPPPGRIVTGEILLDTHDLMEVRESALHHIRGKRMGMIFQEPMTSLNPVMTIGRQMTEGMLKHLGIDLLEAEERAISALKRVGIGDAAERLRGYPHQLSGGLRQRVMIAAALSCGPDLLIADEPTTALDVTIQAQLISLLRELQQQEEMAMLLISHDFGVVSQIADWIAVMYQGKIVEYGRTGELLRTPRHPYTIGLLDSVPRIGEHRDRLRTITDQFGIKATDEIKSFWDFCPEDYRPVGGEPPPLVEITPGHRVRQWR